MTAREVGAAGIRLGLNSIPRTPEIEAVFVTVDDTKRLLTHELEVATDVYGYRNAYRRAEEALCRSVEVLDAYDASSIDLRLVLVLLGDVGRMVEDLVDVIEADHKRQDVTMSKDEAVHLAKMDLLRIQTERECLARVDRAEVRWGYLKDSHATNAELIIGAARLEQAYLAAIGRASSARVRPEFLLRLFTSLTGAAREIEQLTKMEEN